MDEEELRIATLICSQSSNSQSHDLYRLYESRLKGWRFVFSSANGARAGHAVNRSFAAGAVVKSIFQADSVLVLDERTVKDMALLGRAEYPIDYSISLDTDALSRIQPFLEQRTGRLAQEFQEVFTFLSKDEVNCDAWPYQCENLRNLRDPRNYDAIYNKLRAYQVLRFIDASHLRATGEVRATLGEGDLNKQAQEMLVSMLRLAEETPAYEAISEWHRLIFCILVKIILIQLSHPRQSAAKKLFALLEFMDQSLFCMMLPEGLLAQKYFLAGQNLKFFGKVQTNKSNLLKIVGGMAWDLAHRRNIELTLAADTESGAGYFFPAILTFDKGFAEIMDLYSLRACAFAPGSTVAIPFHAHGSDPISLQSSDAEWLCIEEFFTEAAIARRASMGNGKYLDLNSLASALSAELAVVCGVQFDHELDELLRGDRLR